MGAGKTAVGRCLAGSLGFEFFDTDHEIEARTGVDIGFIFEKEGESGFRIREKKVVNDLSRQNSIVLATGGGVIIDADNRAWLSGRGFVVHLAATVDQQMDRTRYGRNRPLLEADNPRQKLEELMMHREPLYCEIAQLTVQTNGRKVPSVSSEIERYLRREFQMGGD